ncbi:g-protein beta wd-40 repeats containing [Colletotrichum karsti]|uniref:G-protein beta wd-40 repeats containing n=1 Tax=Colletotrichum karsti TaxID=1095194 RepID=A0A9P6IEW3_9PEZI|nr:g-protein beta wd-40 repeats containing [Colletotrichum karsti]KAF9879246.1 g-protein beta wd-40 repeats containing [Colletotrichum karsti]
MSVSTPRVVAKEDYTVGWVCAIPVEMAAARGMLDETHARLPEQDPADHNAYTLGQIQSHNVVIACLPSGMTGTTSAATVAKDMLRTFKSIRFGLMVGIGGGAPSSEHDIRLGDIVVSRPSGTSGGVIQYDRGKALQGEFLRTGSLNAPPKVLLAALANLQADHIVGETRIPEFLSNLANKNARTRKTFNYPDGSDDCLFMADYQHEAETASTCYQCDRSRLVQRAVRDDQDPQVHYGNIASGNQVIKDGMVRKRLQQEHDVLCFEMEAAGLMTGFPCIVIRGISDYADSHKNDAWQGYAAATAAAFAKELLLVISPAQVEKEKSVPQLVSATSFLGGDSDQLDSEQLGNEQLDAKVTNSEGLNKHNSEADKTVILDGDSEQPDTKATHSEAINKQDSEADMTVMLGGDSEQPDTKVMRTCTHTQQQQSPAMESLQLAQMLADLSSLNAAEPNAAAALVTANKAIETVEKSTGITPTPRRPTDELRRVHSSQTGSRPGTGTATPARVDKFGRRIMMSPPVLSRSNSAQGSVPGTPKGVSDVRAQFHHQHHHYPQHHLEVPGGQTRAHQQLPEQGEDDLDRASTLMALYEIRAKLKQQDNSSLMKAREKIADLAQKQQQQQQQQQGGSGKKEPEKITSRFTFPK